MQNPSEQPVMRKKKLYGVEFTEFELFSVRMISDYLFLDRFNDSASFVRFEQCFGPLFSSKNKEFKLVEAFKEIVGPKRKYLTFKRMIKAYLNWKLKKSSNYSFNFFMSEVYQKKRRSSRRINRRSTRIFNQKLQKSKNNHKIQCFD